MTTIFSSLSRRQPLHLRFRRARSFIVLMIAIIALFSATVAIGQAAQNFDLACRSNFTVAGGTITGGSFGIVGALGLPMVPPADSNTAPTYAVRSQDFAVRAGFLPGYPTAQVEPAPPLPASNFTQRLPILFARIVRGGC